MTSLKKFLIYSTSIIVICAAAIVGSFGANSKTRTNLDLTSPKINTLTVDMNKITVDWEAVSGAEQYNLYVARESGLSPDTYSLLDGGSAVLDVSSPFSFTVENGGLEYYVIITAQNELPESETKSRESVVVVPYYSKRKNLRIYQNGDSIEYSVMGERNRTGELLPDAFTGTLKIEYTSSNIAFFPGAPETVPVLKETTTFALDDQTKPITLVSYVQQDETGSLKRVAIERERDLRYWLSVNDVGSASSMESPTVIQSPLSESGTRFIEYQVIENCDGVVSCAEFLMSSSGMAEYSPMETVETVAGYFFSHVINTDSVYEQPQALQKPAINYETLCGDSYVNSAARISVFPDIGPVNINVECTNADDERVVFSANMESANFDWLPL